MKVKLFYRCYFISFENHTLFYVRVHMKLLRLGKNNKHILSLLVLCEYFPVFLYAETAGEGDLVS